MAPITSTENDLMNPYTEWLFEEHSARGLKDMTFGGSRMVRAGSRHGMPFALPATPTMEQRLLKQTIQRRVVSASSLFRWQSFTHEPCSWMV